MLSKKSTTTDIKKLLIYETTHFEILSGLLKLSDGHFSEITVFIYDAYYDALQTIIGSEKYTFKLRWICKEEKTNREFIKYFFSYLKENEYSHIHISTLDHNLLFFAAQLLLSKGRNFTMTVHSINTYKYNKYNTLKDLSESVAKQILHKKVKRYRVLAPAMVNYFNLKFPSKEVCFIPGSFYKKKPALLVNKDFFLMVIPGTVSEKRRDYATIVKLLNENIEAYTSKRNIHLVLAGSAGSLYGQKIISQLNKIAKSYSKFRLTTFETNLDQETYELLYRSACLILAPLQTSTKSIRDEDEINGITHSPGFITDEIYMGAPAIVPEAIPLPAEFNDCFWRYNTEEQLNEIVLSLLSDPSLIEEKRKRLGAACENFKAESFKKEFELLFDM